VTAHPGVDDVPKPLESVDPILANDSVALLAEEQSLLQEHAALHLRPDDLPAHAAHRVRLQDQQARLNAYQAALRRANAN